MPGKFDERGFEYPSEYRREAASSVPGDGSVFDGPRPGMNQLDSVRAADSQQDRLNYQKWRSDQARRGILWPMPGQTDAQQREAYFQAQHKGGGGMAGGSGAGGGGSFVGPVATDQDILNAYADAKTPSMSPEVAAKEQAIAAVQAARDAVVPAAQEAPMPQRVDLESAMHMGPMMGNAVDAREKAASAAQALGYVGPMTPGITAKLADSHDKMQRVAMAKAEYEADPAAFEAKTANDLDALVSAYVAKNLDVSQGGEKLPEANRVDVSAGGHATPAPEAAAHTPSVDPSTAEEVSEQMMGAAQESPAAEAAEPVHSTPEVSSAPGPRTARPAPRKAPAAPVAPAPAQRSSAAPSTPPARGKEKQPAAPVKSNSAGRPAASAGNASQPRPARSAGGSGGQGTPPARKSPEPFVGPARPPATQQGVYIGGGVTVPAVPPPSRDQQVRGRVDNMGRGLPASGDATSMDQTGWKPGPYDIQAARKQIPKNAEYLKNAAASEKRKAERKKSKEIKRNPDGSVRNV